MATTRRHVVVVVVNVLVAVAVALSMVVVGSLVVRLSPRLLSLSRNDPNSQS